MIDTAPHPALCGAIDLGGSKIEARLFGPGMETVAQRRIPTPRHALPPFLEALAQQIRWLESEARNPELPIAIALPGVIDPVSGKVQAANLPQGDYALGATVAARIGRRLPLVNDAMAFAWSEAHGGAAEGAASVLGLIVGTGIGAGLVVDGRLPSRHAGLAVEIGHLGMPARALARHDLPLIPCGCGRQGCVESYLAGPGLTRLAEAAGLGPLAPAEIARHPQGEAVLTTWADLAGEVLAGAQMILDPEVIVLGGGVSNLPGIAARLSAAIESYRLGTRAPSIRLAQHGDSSGARGAALLARDGLIGVRRC